VFKKVSYTVFIRILSLAVNMLTFILTAKYFGPSGRGYIAAVTALITTFATIAGFSIGRVLVYEINKSGLDSIQFYRNNIFTLFVFCLLISILVWISALAVWFIRPGVFGETPYIYYVIYFIAAPSVVWQGYSSFIFASLDKLVNQNRILLWGMILYVAIVYIAIMIFEVSFMIFLVIMLIYVLSVGLAEMYAVYKITGMKLWFDRLTAKYLFISGIKLHVDTIGGLLITSSNILIITSYMPVADVGVFQFASQLINMMVILPTMVSLQFNADITSMGPDKAFLKHIRYIWGVLFLMIVGCMLAWLLAPFIINLLGGSEFYNAVPIFRLLLISIIGNSFSILISSQYSGRGYFRLVSGLTIGLGLIGLSASYIGITQYGLLGATYATNIVYSLSFIVNIFFYIYLYRKSIRTEM